MQAFSELVGSITTMTYLLFLTTFPWPEISWREGKRRCSAAGHMNTISLHHKELFSFLSEQSFPPSSLLQQSIKQWFSEGGSRCAFKEETQYFFLFLDPVRFKSRKQIRWKRAEQQDKASLAAEPWAQKQTESPPGPSVYWLRVRCYLLLSPVRV